VKTLKNFKKPKKIFTSSSSNCVETKIACEYERLLADEGGVLNICYYMGEIGSCWGQNIYA